MNDSKPVAVSAASGRLGHAILRHLQGEPGLGPVIAIARDPARVAVDGVEKRAGDYQDADAMAAALAGADTLVLISAPVAGTDRVAMHRNVISAAEQAGVTRVIFTSVIGGSGEEGTLFWPTQQDNRRTEDDLKASGLQWTIGRNGLYLELDVGHIVRAAGADGIYRNNGGDGRCGYITIEELGHAYARLASGSTHAGRTYTLAGDPVTQAEIVAGVNEVFGLNVRYEPISLEQNIARFMADEKVAARGRAVAEMLSGCFQCISKGAFDVPSDYAAATGRPSQSLLAQLEDIRRRLH
jgi:NAD(P)H dehydrogenase (quinone)